MGQYPIKAVRRATAGCGWAAISVRLRLIMDLIVNSITSALFFPRLPIENGVRFANAFIERTGNALDYEPMVLPLQQPAPPDAPRIVLRSRDRSFVCEFALNRVNFHYYNQNSPTQTLERFFPRYREALYRIISTLYEMTPDAPRRMGFVIKLIKAANRNSSEALQAEFLKTEAFDDAAESQMHFLHVLDLEGMKCNRWTRFRSIRMPNSEGPPRHILFEADINTRADIEREYESNEAVSFFLEAYEHIRRQAESLLDFANEES